MKTKDLEIDCVKMMHEAGIRIHEKLEKMSLAEKLEYWRQRDNETLQLQEKLRNKLADKAS